ncbi:sugar transferase, partial [Patescibacteria group bacterium]|nr:sugar transferase [Patescibacteria group bacterium]
ALIGFWRYLHSKYISPAILKTNIVFAGITPEAVELIKIINSEPERGYAVIGIVDLDAGTTVLAGLESMPIASNLSSLREKIFQPIHIVVTAPGLKKNADLLKELYYYLIKQTEIADLAKFYEEITGRIPPFTFSESFFLSNLHEQQKKIYDRFRILVDYFIAVIIALFFLLTFPFIAVSIKYTSKGSLFFKQERIGKNGTTFKIFKYRTMTVLAEDGSAETDGPKFAEAHDGRVTKVGKFLRRSRIDEIPQFINIFRGEMGLIGPRPERPEFVRQLTERMPFYELRHLVKPGLTGWAQLRYGYYGTIDENLRKLEYDLFYIKNRNIFLDAVIVLRTVNVLVRMIGR